MGLATTTVRVGLGSLMAAHGLQKLAGKFGGAGLDATAQHFESMGLSPGRTYATAAGVTETVGGGLLAAGMLTPVGAAMVTGAMTVAIGKVHAKNGMWSTKGGMEYNLLIIGAAFALTEAGPGVLAIDGLLTKRRSGFGWALLELAAGVAAGAGVLALASRNADPGLAVPSTGTPATGAPASDAVPTGGDSVGNHAGESAGNHAGEGASDTLLGADKGSSATN
jgi:putative oxidoreductase